MKNKFNYYSDPNGFSPYLAGSIQDLIWNTKYGVVERSFTPAKPAPVIESNNSPQITREDLISCIKYSTAPSTVDGIAGSSLNKANKVKKIVIPQQRLPMGGISPAFEGWSVPSKAVSGSATFFKYLGGAFIYTVNDDLKYNNSPGRIAIDALGFAACIGAGVFLAPLELPVALGLLVGVGISTFVGLGTTWLKKKYCD